MKHRPKQIIQTTFLIPIKEDQEVGNGQHHPEKRWEKLKELIFVKFSGWHVASELYPGGWISPETGKMIEDESRKYFIDIPRKDLNKMRAFIKEMAVMFKQQCIRFEYEGKVEYIGRG